MITLNYPAFLLTILTAVAVGALVYLIVVLNRLARTSARLEATLGNADELLASLKKLSEETTETVSAARQLINEGTLVAGDLAAVSARVRGLTVEGSQLGESVLGRFKSAVAVVAGLKAAYSTLRHFLHRRQSPAAD